MSNAMQILPVREVDALRNPALMRSLAQQFFVWDAFVGGQARVDAHPLLLPRRIHEAAVRAAEDVVRVVGRVASRALVDRTECAHYAFDVDTLRLAKASFVAGDTASLMRVDLLFDGSGHWRACEINADCPGGHNETVALPHLARTCGFAGGRDPSHVVDRLVTRLVALARGGSVGIILATGYAEDLQVCALVARALERVGTRAILAPPTAPVFQDGHLSIRGERVDSLYRYFPTEWMSGQRNVEAISLAVESGAVRTLTGFAHVFTQSKLAFARAWAAAAQPGDLTDEERAIVDRHLPETYALLTIDRSELVANARGWVVKRAMGRVGDEVFVGELLRSEDWASIVDLARARASSGEAWLAQRFVRQRPVSTPWGERLVTLGAYVEGGRFAGYFARATPQSHVSHDALCVPVFVLED